MHAATAGSPPLAPLAPRPERAAAAQAGIDPLEVLERQTAISMMRGAQSGGLVTLVTKGGHGACSGGGRVEGVRCRVAPSKRQSLAVLLGRQFRRAAGGCRHPGDHGIFVGAEICRRQWHCLAYIWQACRTTVHPCLSLYLPAGHTRFATSSIPLPSESHPHQWSPTAPAVVWRADGRGGVAAATEQLGIWITHNGELAAAGLLAT